MRKRLLVGLLAVYSVMLFSTTVLAADNWLGTWKLNAEKSKGSPPAPKSLTVKFEASQGAITNTSDGVNAEGQPMHGSYTSKWDGKDVPWTGNPDADTASPKRISANSYKNTWKKNGKVTMTATTVVSKDGKTLKISQTGKNSKGESVKRTLVFDRQ